MTTSIVSKNIMCLKLSLNYITFLIKYKCFLGGITINVRSCKYRCAQSSSACSYAADARKVDQLERVVKYTFNNVGNTFSAKAISDYLKAEHRALDNETVCSYLEKLEKAYLLHRCSLLLCKARKS